MGVRLLRGGDDFFLSRLRLAHGDVLPDRPCFQPCVLKHHAHAPAQLAPVHFLGIDPVEKDFAPVRVVKPHEKVDKGSLSAARGADDGHPLAGLDGQVEVPDQGLVRRVREAKVLDLHCALHLFRTFRMLRLRRPRRGFDQLEHPSCAGQRVLQLRHHAGDLVKGLGVLVGVVQEAGEVAHGDAAGNGDQRTAQAHARIHHGVDEPGTGVHQRREENCPQRRLLQPSVDLVELLHGRLLMAEGLHHLDIADGLVDQAGLLAPGNGLELEHGIRPCRNEIRHQQRQRRNADHHQGNAPVNANHENKRSQNGHHAGKQLGKAHEQSVGKGVHVSGHPADHIALRLFIKIGKGQHLNMPEGFVPDVPGDAVGHVVVDLIHEPLRQRRHGGANRHVAQIAPHGGKIHPSGIDNAVNGISHQNGDI